MYTFINWKNFIFDPQTIGWHRQKIPDNGIVTCVYWEDKTTEEGQSMRWSVDGCWVSFSHENYTVCSCSHLSTFALILQISDVSISASIFHIPSANHSLGQTFTLFSVLATLWSGTGAGRYSEIGCQVSKSHSKEAKNSQDEQIFLQLCQAWGNLESDESYPKAAWFPPALLSRTPLKV